MKVVNNGLGNDEIILKRGEVLNALYEANRVTVFTFPFLEDEIDLYACHFNRIIMTNLVIDEYTETEEITVLILFDTKESKDLFNDALRDLYDGDMPEFLGCEESNIFKIANKSPNKFSFKLFDGRLSITLNNYA